MTEKQLFKAKNAYLEERYGKAIPPMEFYRDLFPEGSLEGPGSFDGKPNIIATSGYRKSDKEIERLKEKENQEKEEYDRKRSAGERVQRPRKYKRRWAKNTIITDDLGGLSDLLNDDSELLEFVIIPAVAFSGKNRTLENAYHLWGFAIDLDGVGLDQLGDLIHQIENDAIPEPTYIVNSGHGLHVYYMFEDAIPMYPRLHGQLQELKKALTDVVWNAYTSTIPVEKRQYQSIVQGYRAVGSPSKLGRRYRVTAFLTGSKHTLRYLMDWAETEKGVDFDEFSHVTLDQAKEKWPEWYQWKIVEKNERKPFYYPRAVYDSWKKRMAQGAFDGNRYNCIAVMFSLAIRCQIEFDEVLSDAMGIVPRLNRLTQKPSNEFTVDDVLDASSFYDEAFFNIGLKKIYRMTKIHIEPTKRNKRRRADHLRRARALQASDDPNGDWRYRGGAPKKCEVVAQYRKEHPEASVTEVARALGISRPTVYKWWDGAPPEPVQKPLKAKTVPKPKKEPAQWTDEQLQRELAKMLLRMTPEQRATLLAQAEEIEEE